MSRSGLYFCVTKARVMLRLPFRAVRALFVCALFVLPAMADDQPAVLSVDQAVKLAVANNRMLKITSLQLADTKENYLAFKTHRYPTFNTYIFASELLAPISFTVPAGQFGTYPGIGPIPATNTPITTPQQPTAYVMANVSQPLLTLYKINIGIAGQGAVGGHGGAAVGGKAAGGGSQCARNVLHGIAVRKCD